MEAIFGHLGKGDMLDDPLPSDTRIGHIHLHVRDIKEALDFYHGIIGFDIMGVSHGIGLAFVSAGGYHHHIGLNTWLGKDIPPAPEGALGLEYFSVDLPDQKALDQVAARLDAAGISALERENGLLVGDPSQINLLFKVK